MNETENAEKATKDNTFDATQWSVEIDRDKLLNWMDKQGLASGPIENAELLVGGTQNILQKFDRGGQTFVLRRPPVKLRKNSNEAMEREAVILKAIKESSVPHPRYIDSCKDHSVIGVSFYLMENIDGFNPNNGLPDAIINNPKACERMGYSWIEALATLGSLNYRELGLEGFGKPEGFLERQAPRWMAQLESYSQIPEWTGLSALPDVEKIVSWLDQNKPSDYQPGIMHGDCHLANTMFDKNTGELAALIDWELSTVGDPLVDLGWVIATTPDGPEDKFSTMDTTAWTGFPTQQELIAHYQKHSERNLEHLDWYAVLACFKLAVILEGTHARACAGKAPRDVGDLLHSITIGLLEKAHRRI